jgi:hypothetical protein
MQIANDRGPKKLGRFSAFLLITLLIAAVCGSLAWLAWDGRTQWPTFPSDVVAGQAPTEAQKAAAASLAPEVVVVVDRDYGYRIGDVIPVTIFFKEKAGSEIDLHSMAVDGDFEIVGEPTFFARSAADGSRRLRVEVKLQSFSPVPKLVLNANLSYRVKATNDDVTVTLPALEAYTSNTWDGRDIVQEGKLPFNPGLDPFATGGLVLGGLFGSIFFFSLFLRYRRERPIALELKGLPNRFLLARRDFNEIWARMEAGDRSADRYAELSQLLRRLYKVETKTTLEASYFLLYSYNGPIQVADILRTCDRVIYRDEVLSEEDHLGIKAVFDYLVPSYSAEALAKLPPTKVVLASAAASSKR